ncbi:MAG TPA: futalosine hydrolase [Bacteroidales bacterium]|nr:futalosine hydrolase [Bacteroidales bacterium]
MKLLVVSATRIEVEEFVRSLGQPISHSHNHIRFGGSNLDTEIIITGVGMVATSYQLGRLFAVNHYDLAINAGICGSFERSLAIGRVVQVVADSFGDLGAEDNDKWIPVSELVAAQKTGDQEIIADAGQYNDLVTSLLPVKGVTVNTVHGNTASIERFRMHTDAGTETMEGAAFMYACKIAGLKFMQIRSISNYVEPRDTSKWNISLAISNLNNELQKIHTTLKTHAV